MAKEKETRAEKTEKEEKVLYTTLAGEGEAEFTEKKSVF